MYTVNYTVNNANYTVNYTINNANNTVNYNVKQCKLYCKQSKLCF